MRTIGIIGGVGPLATSLYYRALVDKVVAATQGQLPEIFIHSLPVDSGMETAFIRGSSQVETRISEQIQSLMLRSLEIFIQNKIKVVAMPCNTLQSLLEDTCERMHVHNINLITETSRRVVEHGLRHVLIVGTTSTCRSNEYGKSLARLGVGYKYLPEGDQVLAADHILYSLRAPHANSPYLIQFVDCIVRACRDVDGVILGCTDLTNHVASDVVGVPVIDSLQALIDRTVDYVLS
ncbi:MAG: aspartate racemase [Ktedonobacteraceae bacterium]